MRGGPWAALVVVLVGGGATAERALAINVVHGIRTWSSPERTRIVIDSSQAPKFEEKTLTKPDRIVINIEGARFLSTAKPVTVDDGCVDRIRTNTLKSGIAQVVVDLPVRRTYKVFPLKPGDNGYYRIVIDVNRPESATERAARRARAQRLKAERTTIVMIDPGHGGEDPGALGAGGLQEKWVCLQIGLKLRAEIDATPGFKAFMTRDQDYFVSLRRRTALAREQEADYFISIHANAHKKPNVRGTEVYFLSLGGASDDRARDVALRENTAHLIHDVPRGSRSEVENILQDLIQTAVIEHSSLLATSVISALEGESGLTIRGVKQAGFDVLKTAGVPSILVEAAFVTHRAEARLLKSAKFHHSFAKRLARGVVRHVRAGAQLGAAGD